MEDHGHTGHILVADDNRLNRIKLVHSLEKDGHTVIAVENGQQALEQMYTQTFDIVLLDLVMPGMDGYQVLEKIKADETLLHIPVIVISALDEMRSVIRCIKMGAADYLPKPFDPVLLSARINASLTSKRMRDREISLLQRVQAEKERGDKLLNIVIPIGVALSGESDFNKMLERILKEAMAFSHADAGTLYIRTENDKLRFEIVYNHSLDIALGGTTGQPVSFPPLSMYDEKGKPEHRYIVTHAAHTGKPINVPDAYEAQGFDFSGTRAFDARTGYRSKSFLASPLKNPQDKVIGVLQLINAQDLQTGEIIPFDANMTQMIASLSLLAAVALDSYRREQGLREQIAQLKIEIDEVKAANQVAEITSTDYFRTLQQKAKGLRAQRKK